ncbi:uncharacterized protein LOC106755752 [Vigna radiata var. radiata]|uniref:Uncharacterized protein LOC106755752 n=1 Tax=Vigna radiata var. radiata TaxID=3916 RepID=A0A1S3TI64_VIGRR|nr:uncharacterized protein LOC106755752 [Vigna radiata var. radiata]
MAKVVNGMSVPQLSENINYDNWSLQIEVLLESQDVWDIVEDRYNEPANDEHQSVNQVAALKKTRVKDRSALYFLYNVVDESGFEKIVNAKSAKEAWEILKVAYKGDTRVKQVRVQVLRREFEHMEMDENEGVSEFITRVQKMANQLGMNGEEVPPNQVAEKILRNLMDDFESIVVTIEETKDLSTLTMEELAGSLKAHELRKKKKKREPDNQTLQVRFNWNKSQITQSRGPGGRGRGGRGRGGRGRGNDNEDQTGQQNWHDRGQGKDRGDRSRAECFRCGKYDNHTNDCMSTKCYDCGKFGHIARYCETETKGETNLVTNDGEEECGILLMAKSSDVVDMESPIPTMDEVISVKDATIVEKENLEKELKGKDEEIRRIGRLLDETNEIMNKQKVELEELKKRISALSAWLWSGVTTRFIRIAKGCALRVFGGSRPISRLSPSDLERYVRG